MSSLYTYKPKQSIQKEEPYIHYDINKEQIKKYFRDGIYKKVEDYIIQALFFHHYLTKYNITRYLNKKLGKEKWNDYSNLIKQMWKDGTIERYRYDSVVLYHLSKAGMEFAETKYKNMENRRVTEPKTDDASVLECASLAQWHITLYTREKMVRSCFYETKIIGQLPLLLPSYCEFVRGDYFYHVASYVLPKNEKLAEDFFVNIKTLSHALRGKVKTNKRKDVYLTVLLAENTGQIEKASFILENINATRDVAFYFALEEQTALMDGMEMLYSVESKKRDTYVKTIYIARN